MYNVSEQFLQKMSLPAQRRRCYGFIDSYSFTSENIIRDSATITNQCSDNTNISIGQVYIGELNIKLRGLSIPRKSYRGREITIYQGLEISDGIYEDVLLGHYFVEEAKWDVSGISIKAYDVMAKADKKISTIPSAATAYDYVLYMCAACDIPFGMTQQEFYNLPNSNIQLRVYEENDMETWRDLLSWCAQTVGCNATINRDGELIFIAYNQNIVDSYNSRRRLSGAVFSDFDTFYTGISMVNISDQTTSYYGLEIDNGLTMNLGSNPFLQYGTDIELELQRRRILNSLVQIYYTPAKIRLNALMIYDLMDVITFYGGIISSQGLIYVCITKFTWKLNGDYTIECVGSDPALASAKSKVDKNISGLLSQLSENEMHYYDFVNGSSIDILNQQEVEILNVAYISKKDTHVDFHCEVKYVLSTIELETNEYFQENDGMVTVKYYMGANGDEYFTEYQPVECNQDGTHLLHLLHFWAIDKYESGKLKVTITASNCNISIGQGCIRGFISGQGLVGDVQDWDGTITISDEIEAIMFNNIVTGISDNAFGELVNVNRATHNDAIQPISFTGIVGITDSVTASNNMFFSTTVNRNLLSTTATVSNNSFINGSVITPNIYGIEGVKINATGGSYTASFDGGSTWLGYSQTLGWITGITMSKSEIESVLDSDWISPAMIKAELTSNETLQSINVLGGYINV